MMMYFLLFVIVVLTAFYAYLTRKRGYLEKLGIPLEKPFLCFGSPPYLWHKIIPHDYYVGAFSRLKTKTYGRYVGSTPTIVTIDPDLIKEITIKQFPNFAAVFIIEADDKYKSLDLTYGELWKNLRKELTPAFTSGKLKGMLEPMQEMTPRLIETIQSMSSESQSIHVHSFFRRVALDVIGTCAFGIKTDALNNSDHPLVIHGEKIITEFQAETPAFNAFQFLFEHIPELNKFFSFFPKSYNVIIDATKAIIARREEENTQTKDFINILIEMKKKLREDPSSLLNDQIVVAQGVIFFLAGMETIAQTMASLMYILATNPEIQDRIVEEPQDDDSYVEAVVQEVLRIHPAATITLRTCTNDTTVNGLYIKKGTLIELPIYASHHDPDYFPDPEAFRPERFFKENASDIKPHSYHPFGDGNRICIGMRFAMVEIVTITKGILQKFKVEATSDTKKEFTKGSKFMLGLRNVKVRFVPRE